MHKDGTIDICFISNGHVMKKISRYDCKGIEHGRLLRFIFWIMDNFWDAVFFVQRRIPLWPCTMSKSEYLHAKYGRTGMYQQEVKDCFKELNIRSRKQQYKWVELWANIDIDESNGMNIHEFCKYFDLVEGTSIVQRTFEIFNRSVNTLSRVTKFSIYSLPSVLSARLRTVLRTTRVFDGLKTASIALPNVPAPITAVPAYRALSSGPPRQSCLSSLGSQSRNCPDSPSDQTSCTSHEGIGESNVRSPLHASKQFPISDRAKLPMRLETERIREIIIVDPQR